MSRGEQRTRELRTRELRARELRAHGPRPRGQGGYALLVVIAAIGVATLLIGALFGLMFTTMEVTKAEERDARENRAADAAIETAINKLRTGTCDPLTPIVDDMDFTQDSTATGDDVVVDVTCTSVPTGSAATDQVRIVGGDGYQGSLRNGWTADCMVDATVTGCLPWADKVGSKPTGLSSSKTSLVHSGPQPLEFSSGVTVRTGAAALRTDANGTPAIRVGGQYTQGSKGILGSGATDCGMLTGSPGTGAGQVLDIDAQPGCGDETAAGAAAAPPVNDGLTPPAGVISVPANCPSSRVVTFVPGTYTVAQTAAVSRLTSGTGSGCTNKTFHFTPGIYSFEGSELRFASAGSAYVFGAPKGWTAGASGTGVQGVTGLMTDVSAEATLCDPAVSGTTLKLAGWTRLTHTRGRVAVCPNRPAGTDVSGAPLQPHPAILQEKSLSQLVWVCPGSTNDCVPNTNPAPIFAFPNDALNIRGTDLPFSCRTDLRYPYYGDLSGGVCRPQRTYLVTLNTTGTAAVSSLRVMLTGTESTLTPNNLITNRRTRFRLISTTGNASICVTNFVTGMPNGGLTSSFDLKTMPGTCSTTDFNQTQLNGARLFVDHQMDLGLPTVTQAFTINKVAVEVNAASGSPATATSNDWNNVGNVTEVDNASASPNMPAGCGASDFVCSVPDPTRSRRPGDREDDFVHEMQLGDFSFAGLLDPTDPGDDPSLESLRVVVKVQPSALTLPSSWTTLFGSFLSPQNFLIPGTMRLELRAPNGEGRCFVQGRGINSDQEIAFDLRNADLEVSGPGCSTFVFDTASKLENVSLLLRFSLPCVPDYNLDPNGLQHCLRQLGENPNVLPAQPVWQMRPPNIESVRLTTVTDFYGLAGTSTVTLNATNDASTISTFNVLGRTWMPLADLDLNWNGPVGAQPLFANDLVLHGLGSRMASGAAMGNVCCNAAGSRTVELTASIGGVDRLVARVEYVAAVGVNGQPVPAMGNQVNVLRWLSCGAEGCDDTLERSDEAPS